MKVLGILRVFGQASSGSTSINIVQNTGKVVAVSATVSPDPVVVKEYHYKDSLGYDRYVYDTELNLTIQFKRTDINIINTKMAFMFYYSPGAKQSYILINGKPYDGSQVIFPFLGSDYITIKVYAHFRSDAWMKPQTVNSIGFGTVSKDIQYSGSSAWVGDGEFQSTMNVVVQTVGGQPPPFTGNPPSIKVDSWNISGTTLTVIFSNSGGDGNAVFTISDSSNNPLATWTVSIPGNTSSYTVSKDLSFLVAGKQYHLVIVDQYTGNTLLDEWFTLQAPPPSPPTLPTPSPPPSPTTTKVSLTIISHEGGTTNPAPGTYQYDKGSSVSITALPNSGYSFDHWTVNGSIAYSNPLSLTLESDTVVEAYFGLPPTPPELVPTPPQAPQPQPQPALPPETTPQPAPQPQPQPQPPVQIIISEPTGSETPPAEELSGIPVKILVASGAGDVEPSPGTHYYEPGTEVVIKASPDPGYSFDYFLIDGSTAFFKPSMKLTVNAEHTVEVYFSPGVRKTRFIIPKLLYRFRKVFK